MKSKKYSILRSQQTETIPTSEIHPVHKNPSQHNHETVINRETTVSLVPSQLIKATPSIHQSSTISHSHIPIRSSKLPSFKNLRQFFPNIKGPKIHSINMVSPLRYFQSLNPIRNPNRNQMILFPHQGAIMSQTAQVFKKKRCHRQSPIPR